MIVTGTLTVFGLNGVERFCLALTFRSRCAIYEDGFSQL